MAPPQQDEDRRPPPLGLRGLSRVAFQPRTAATGGLPPLGLAGRGRQPSFSIGTDGRERAAAPSILLRRRVGLSHPARPPAPHEAGSSNWSTSVAATGGLPPLGLAGRGRQPSYSIGTADSERAAAPSVLPRRRVGLSHPARPPAPHEAGSSNWSTSVARSGTGTAGTDRSAFVGLSLVNGDGGISFGGREFAAFNLSSRAGGIRIGEAPTGGTLTGIGGDGADTMGYRDKGYNPNFEHADEYPPSQEHVQSRQSQIDLNVMANKKSRRHYDTNEKRHILAMIYQRNGKGTKMKRGVTKAVAEEANCPRRVVQRIWNESKK
uniref:Uncharacterized protein n=1 Tax=Avena sativa TaxID=4498 RepID=A0ACD5VI89_AVESA